jgi:hypothetical protein
MNGERAVKKIHQENLSRVRAVARIAKKARQGYAERKTKKEILSLGARSNG